MATLYPIADSLQRTYYDMRWPLNTDKACTHYLLRLAPSQCIGIFPHCVSPKACLFQLPCSAMKTVPVLLNPDGNQELGGMPLTVGT